MSKLHHSRSVLKIIYVLHEKAALSPNVGVLRHHTVVKKKYAFNLSIFPCRQPRLVLMFLRSKLLTKVVTELSDNSLTVVKLSQLMTIVWSPNQHDPRH